MAVRITLNLVLKAETDTDIMHIHIPFYSSTTAERMV